MPCPCFAFAHAHQLVKIRGFHRFVIKLRDANSCEIKTNGFHVDNLENGVRKSSETMDDLENVPDKVNFVPCVKWVGRGKAKNIQGRTEQGTYGVYQLIESKCCKRGNLELR